MLDVACGDFFWLSSVDLGEIDYIGADIVAEMVRQNSSKFAGHRRSFIQLDLCETVPPQVDLIFSRDTLVHLSFKDIKAAIDNMVRSGSRYLLTTTFPDTGVNRNIATGMWRPLNLCAAPFLFPQPLEIICEGYRDIDSRYPDKSMALWLIADISKEA